jgi:hypothetical protein
MRIWGQTAAAIVISIAGIHAVQAESGSFFKNLLGGGGGSSDGGGDATVILSGPKLQDPDSAYCPQIDVGEGGAAIQAYAGAAGDGSHLRHQITFGRMSRECTPRPGGAVGVRVGVEVRALLGPAGSPGTYDAPLTISLKYNDQVVASRSRRVAIAIPAGAAQGQTAVVEDEMIVPADKAVGYDIQIALGGGSAKPKGHAKSAARRGRKAAPAEATATPGMPTFEGQ